MKGLRGTPSNFPFQETTKHKQWVFGWWLMWGISVFCNHVVADVKVKRCLAWNLAKFVQRRNFFALLICMNDKNSKECVLKESKSILLCHLFCISSSSRSIARIFCQFWRIQYDEKTDLLYPDIVFFFKITIYMMELGVNHLHNKVKVKHVHVLVHIIKLPTLFICLCFAVGEAERDREIYFWWRRSVLELCTLPQLPAFPPGKRTSPLLWPLPAPNP